MSLEATTGRCQEPTSNPPGRFHCFLTLTELLKFLVIAGILTIADFFLQGHIGVWRLVSYLSILIQAINLFWSHDNLSRQFPNIRRSLETGKVLRPTFGGRWCVEPKIEKASKSCLTMSNLGLWRRQAVLRRYCLQANQVKPSLLWAIYWSGKSFGLSESYFYRLWILKKERFDRWSRYSPSLSCEPTKPYGDRPAGSLSIYRTIASNVAKEDHIDREAVQDALKKSGLAFRWAPWKGIDHPDRRKGSAFSSGERQDWYPLRGSLYKESANLLWMRQPLTSDTETEEIIQKAMAVLKGPTTFIIAHRFCPLSKMHQI